MKLSINKTTRAICLLLFSVVGIAHVGVRINVSQSMPLGLYLIQQKKPTRGDIVAVCLPKKLAREGLEHKYILHGICPSHSMPLLKVLIAIPGDKVIATQKKLCVNHHCYPAPVLQVDSHQHQITRFINESNGKTKQYWIYGAHDKVHSWDSRYFGGVTRNQILAVYTPLLTLNQDGEYDSPRHSPPKSHPPKQIHHTHPALGVRSHSILVNLKFPDPAPTTNSVERPGSGTEIDQTPSAG